MDYLSKYLKNVPQRVQIKVEDTQPNTIDFFDEESRQSIYLWSAEREKKEQRSTWYRLRIYMIDFKMMKTFLDGITIMVVICILLTCLATYVCVRFGISFNFQASIAVSPLVFPLSFLIRGDFQRRERALEYLAEFRAAIYSIFLLCREWKSKVGVSENAVSVILNKLLQVIVHVKEYLQTRSKSKRAYLVQIAYEDFSDLIQLLELYHNQKMAGIGALMARLHLTGQSLIGSFEKLRVIRDYRSPRSARSFAKIMIFLTPILFSPLYVYMGKVVQKSQNWTPYVFGAVTAFVFGCLQSVQDRLDDPFLGVTYDEIDLDDLHNWAIESLKHNANRTDAVGRFTIQSEQAALSEDQQKELEEVQHILKDHPYLSALNSASSTKTIRITKSREMLGKNRVIFISTNEKSPESKTEPSSTGNA